MSEVPGSFVESDGLSIHFEVHGAGPPVVLAHGWGASTESNWNAPGWTAVLATDHTVIGIDIRGHGWSDKPHDRSRYGYASMAHDVVAVLDHLELARSAFVGYSLGAFSGMHLLGHHADRVSAAVLIGIGDETPASIAAADGIATALRADDAASLEDPTARMIRAYVDADRRNDREALALSALEMWPEGFPRSIGGDGLVDLAVPVLILNGAEDRPYVDSDEALVAAIPGAELVHIDGVDHVGGVYDPRFKDSVIDFLGRVYRT